MGVTQHGVMDKEYGLMYGAEHVALEMQVYLEEAFQAEGFQFFLDLVQARGGLALEVGAASGRLLLPYVSAGLHVHGVEASADLIALCLAKAKSMGIVPTIHHQKINEITLPMSFKTIYAPAHVFEQGGGNGWAATVIQKLYEHLDTHGLLIVALRSPHKHFLQWKQDAWELISATTREYDGAQLMLSQTIKRFLLDQRIDCTKRYEILSLSGNVQTFVKKVVLRWFHKKEFIGLLERAGFGEISVLADYTMSPATDDSDVMVFLAKKRG